MQNSKFEKRIISILVDSPNSWIMPFAEKLVGELNQKGHNVRLCHDNQEIEKGDFAFFVGCEKIVSQAVLNLNKHNLVIHESALPLGKG